MKVIRKITFEVADDDPRAEEKLSQQLIPSARPGVYALLAGDGKGLTITVEHVEGPQWPSDGRAWGGPRPVVPYEEKV